MYSPIGWVKQNVLKLCSRGGVIGAEEYHHLGAEPALWCVVGKAVESAAQQPVRDLWRKEHRVHL